MKGKHQHQVILQEGTVLELEEEEVLIAIVKETVVEAETTLWGRRITQKIGKVKKKK